VLTSPLRLRPLIRRPLTRVNSYGLNNYRSPQRPLGHTRTVKLVCGPHLFCLQISEGLYVALRNGCRPWQLYWKRCWIRCDLRCFGRAPPGDRQLEARLWETFPKVLEGRAR
jgi:hypothetical protein